MIPKVVVVTDADVAAASGRDVLRQSRAAASVGPEVGVLVRDKGWPRPDRQRLATALRGVTDWLAVAGDLEVAVDVRADAVHLAAADPPVVEALPLAVGRSCHRRDEVTAAASSGLDYVTLSPIYAPRSKPGDDRPPLGPGALTGLPLPVLALGGVVPGRAAECTAAGAAGVAVCGAVMTADDPGEVVRRILEEITT